MTPPVTSDHFPDCGICHIIWSGLTESRGNRTPIAIHESSFEEALSSKCSKHKAIVKWFKTFCVRLLEHTSLELSAAFTIETPRSGVLKLTENPDTWNPHEAELLLVRRECVERHSGIARILDPRWVDVAVVDYWRKQCASSHGTRCENPLKIWPVRPAWVVDTKNKCLVPGKECDSFIALSYRWGKAQGLKIQADTMSLLQEPDALDDPAISSQLAPMVRHAIFLTLMIGERYLWVDTLCIDHSRASESTQQLQLMGAIYANASLTIVALDGDAEDGLPGLKGVSPERKLYEKPVLFGEEQFIPEEHGTEELGADGSYHERGWTYQEFNMSPRRLIFSKGSLHWMCQCSVWEEHLHHGVQAFKGINHAVGKIMRGIPNLESFSGIVDEYNTRSLTYDEDALPGIFGLLTVFSRSFSGGFLCGIPEMFFDAALSWVPSYPGNLRRRVASERRDSDRLRPCNLPSWSWVGWQGRVSMWRYEAGAALPQAPYIKETIPITQWFTCNSPTSLDKRRIKSSWFENRESSRSLGNPLLPGWTQHTSPEVPTAECGESINEYEVLYPDGGQKYTFRHCKMTEDDDSLPRAWYWPFPVSDIQESAQPFMPEQTSYLCCDTQRARARARIGHGGGNEAMVFDEQDELIGTLFLHNSEQRQRFPRADASSATATEIELVAISRECRYDRTVDWETKSYGHTFTKVDLYMALWVEWIDGVAYRLGIAEIHKEYWEGLALEDVSLILG